MLECHPTRGHHLRENQIRRHYEAKISSYQSQLRSLACQLSLAEDLERRWVMQELHDGMVQDLAGVQIKLGAIRKMAPGNGIINIIDEVRGEVNHAIQNIRSMIFENSPRLLDGKGLLNAIKSLVSRTTEKHGLDVKFTSDNIVKEIDRHYQVFIYRAIRELLINIVNHASAKHVLISIKKAPAKNAPMSLLIQITDDGIGFNTNHIDFFVKNQHFGLNNIIERTQHYKGRVAINSAVGKGCRVIILLPLELTNTLYNNGSYGEGKTTDRR
jgi:signal transduction histidine kinase